MIGIVAAIVFSCFFLWSMFSYGRMAGSGLNQDTTDEEDQRNHDNVNHNEVILLIIVILILAGLAGAFSTGLSVATLTDNLNTITSGQ